jgi:outer membrane protein W
MSLRRLLRHAIFLAFLALLGSLLILPATAFGEDPNEASEEAEETPQPNLNFRFEPPRASLGFRGGWAFNRSEGEIYDFLTEQLTLEKSDFDAPAFAFDFSWRLKSWMDVVFGVEYSGRETKSEDRNFTDIEGNAIVQETRLSQVPLTLSLKFYPIGRGRQVSQYAWVRKTVVPYIGGGIGGTWYELKQKGEFVHTPPPSPPPQEQPFIFEDVFTSNGWAFAQHVFLGFDFKLTRNFGLILEGRYYWAEADVQGDYVGFDPIDLNGARLMLGFNWKL